MPEGRHIDRVIGWFMAIQCHVAGVPERDHQLAQFWCFGERTAYVRCLFEEQELLLDGLTGALGGLRLFPGQKLRAASQPDGRTLRDDYAWHSGIAFSSSLPQVLSHVRTSSPVRCRPVS